MLAEIALAVEQGHDNHRDAEIRGGTHGIPSQNAQAARIGRHGLGQADLHGEVSDIVLAVHIFQRIPEKSG